MDFAACSKIWPAQIPLESGYTSPIAVTACDKSCRFVLDCFDTLNICYRLWTPCCRSIFKLWTNQSLIG